MERELRVPVSFGGTALLASHHAYSERDRALRNFSRAAAAATAVLALAALLGFAVGIRALASLNPGHAPMKPNSALCILALATAVRALASDSLFGAQRGVLRFAAGFALLVSITTLCEYLFGFSFGIDEIVLRDPWTDPALAPPGRTGRATAGAITLLSVAVLLAERGFAYTFAQALAIAAGSVGALALVGYAFGAKALYVYGSYSSVGPSVALSLVLLAAGMLAAAPDRGIAALATANSMGGSLTRRLVPAAFLVPFLLASLAHVAMLRGLASPQLAIALFVVLSTGVLGAMVLHTAQSLHQLDEIRSRSERLLRESTGRVRHLSALVDGSSSAIVSFDALGRVVTWNPRAERVFGRRTADAMGRRASEVFLLPEAREIGASLEQVLRQGAVRRIALRFEMRGGGLVEGVLVLSPLIDWERRTVGACAVLDETRPAEGA